MSSSGYVSLSVGRDRFAERADDLYQTPAEAVHALLDHVELPEHLWEPAAGRGAISSLLRDRGHKVIASDLVDYGEPSHFARVDFLMEHRLPDKCQCIVTNPPFKLANEFVRHALDLSPRVVMLLRLAFLEGKSRSDILDGGRLHRVLVFKNRLPMMHRDNWPVKKTGSAIAFAWYVWGPHPFPTQIERIAWKAT